MPGRRGERSFFQIEVGELHVWVYKKSFEQGDSMGTGTTSDADWACHGDEKNVHFFIEEGELQVWVYKKGFEQGDSIGTGTTSDADWACRGGEKNVHFFQIEEGDLHVF
jgi:hypothetical protein